MAAMALAEGGSRRPSFLEGFNLGTMLQLGSVTVAIIAGIFSTYLAMTGRMDELSRRSERTAMQVDELQKQFNARTEEQKAFVRDLYQQLTKIQETLVDVRISVAGHQPPPPGGKR
jgi:hypothetical protein